MPCSARYLTNQAVAPSWRQGGALINAARFVIIIGMAKPQSSDATSAEPSHPRAALKAPSLRKATSRSPGRGIWTDALDEARISPLGQPSGRISIDNDCPRGESWSAIGVSR